MPEDGERQFAAWFWRLATLKSFKAFDSSSDSGRQLAFQGRSAEIKRACRDSSSRAQ
jgi:hypothetical protein